MLKLTIERCNINDKMFLFELANDKEVRGNAKNTNQIKWEDHSNWFDKKLKDDSTYLYLLKSEEPIGQIRFDLINDEWVIDYAIIPKFRGQGYGSLLVNYGINQLLKDLDKTSMTIVGEVFDFNIGSCKVFEKLGFEKIGPVEGNNKLIVFKKVV